MGGQDQEYDQRENSVRAYKKRQAEAHPEWAEAEAAAAAAAAAKGEDEAAGIKVGDRYIVIHVPSAQLQY